MSHPPSFMRVGAQRRGSSQRARGAQRSDSARRGKRRPTSVCLWTLLPPSATTVSRKTNWTGDDLLSCPVHSVHSSVLGPWPHRVDRGTVRALSKNWPNSPVNTLTNPGHSTMGSPCRHIATLTQTGFFPRDARFRLSSPQAIIGRPPPLLPPTLSWLAQKPTLHPRRRAPSGPRSLRTNGCRGARARARPRWLLLKGPREALANPARAGQTGGGEGRSSPRNFAS
jgi:hypothetical protein